MEGFEKPYTYTNANTHEEICPDISFIGLGGAKSYTEIAIKQDNEVDLVTRWKLLSQMATYKSGRLHLLAPRGHKAFTQKLVDDYHIAAEIHSI